MKITVEFENGMSITTKPETLQMINSADQVIVVTRTADGAPVPLFYFNGQIATQDELAARKAKAAADSVPRTEGAPAPATEPPAAPVTPAKKARK